MFIEQVIFYLDFLYSYGYLFILFTMLTQTNIKRIWKFRYENDIVKLYFYGINNIPRVLGVEVREI